jgi:hypothetical protein
MSTVNFNDGRSKTYTLVLMLQEVLEDDDFLKVSSEKRLVNISGTVRETDFTGERYGSTAYAYGSIAAPPLLWWQKLELNE